MPVATQQVHLVMTGSQPLTVQQPQKRSHGRTRDSRRRNGGPPMALLRMERSEKTDRVVCAVAHVSSGRMQNTSSS